MSVKFAGRIKPLGKLRVARTPSKILPPAAPRWITQPGYLGSFDERVDLDYPIVVTDPNDDILTYTLTAGALPGGVTLNQFSGHLTGKIADVTSNTNYAFSVQVSDGTGFFLNGDFTMTVKDVPTRIEWETNNNLGDVSTGKDANTGVKAVSK